MNEERKKEYELLEKELKNVNKMIDETDNILKKINRNIFILSSDIIGNDKYHSYIGIKSNDDTSPNIKIINEEDLENKDLNMNNLEELIKKNMNLKVHLNVVENNNNNHFNDYSDKMLYKDNPDNKTQLYSNIIKDNPFPPIELCLMSPQDRIIDYNNDNDLKNI